MDLVDIPTRTIEVVDYQVLVQVSYRSNMDMLAMYE